MKNFKEVDALEISSIAGKSWAEIECRVDTTITEKRDIFCYVLKDGTRSGWMDKETK